MKTKLLLLLATALTLSGCGDNKKAEKPMTKMHKVDGNDLADIFVINIEGFDYILVLGAYKAAICPMTKIN